MRYRFVLLTLSLSGCVEESNPKQATVAARELTTVTSQKQLEQDAKRIEQAAEQAVKLIEAEAKDETDRTANEAE